MWHACITHPIFFSIVRHVRHAPEPSPRPRICILRLQWRRRLSKMTGSTRDTASPGFIEKFLKGRLVKMEAENAQLTQRCKKLEVLL